MVDSAEAGIRAAERGATAVQLRAPERTAAYLLGEAITLAGRSRVTVLVSSRCDIALAAGAAGVNLPENDIGVEDARSLLGAGRLISRSVHSLPVAVDSATAGADWLVFGPVWETSSHPGRRAQGIAALRNVVRAVDIPVIAIGGVTAERVAEVHSAGAAGYASISMFR